MGCVGGSCVFVCYLVAALLEERGKLLVYLLSTFFC